MNASKQPTRKSPSKPLQSRRQASYTEDGFYKKDNYQPSMNLSNLSQKQSIYDHRIQGNAQTTQGFGYTTLNPTRYQSSAHDLKEEEYQILAVFELNREREKNRMLEQRLANKEIHIAKMKDVQYELTEAFEKCQAELEYYKRKCAQPVDVREYVEEINELKHLVIRLQDKITQYEKRQNKRYSSVNHDHQSGANSHDRANISRFKAGGDSNRNRMVRDKRSKTIANQQDSSPEFKKFNAIEEYVMRYPSRIANFISQFMAMVECFSSQAQKISSSSERNNTKRRMKVGWKWIKEVVIDWNRLKNYEQKAKGFHSRLKKIFNVGDNANDEEIMEKIMNCIDG